MSIPKLKTYKLPFFLFELNGKYYITDVRYDTEGELPGKVVHEDDALVLALRKLDELYMKYLEEKERKKKTVQVKDCTITLTSDFIHVIDGDNISYIYIFKPEPIVEIDLQDKTMEIMYGLGRCLTVLDEQGKYKHSIIVINLHGYYH